MNVVLRWLVPAVVFATTLWAHTEYSAALPQDSTLDRARQLVREESYREAYDLLAPLREKRPDDPDFNYLLARATLGMGRAEEAVALFERSLELRPDWVDAHLGLGRAYFALEDYGAARIEFETVLRFDNLPPDLLTQAEIYDQAAEQYLDDGKLLVGFGYLQGGVGHYWENPTALTTQDPDKRRDPFYQARGGFGLNYEFPRSYALDANLDYRFRHFDNHEIRNESDWRWVLAVSRNVAESNVALGLRGRVTYVGRGQYRNDYGVFGNWRYRVQAVNQFSVGAEVRGRRYPSGPLRDRSRTIGEATVGWVRSLGEGAGTVSLTGRGGYEWATQRPEGNTSFFGAGGVLNFVLAGGLDAFGGGNWAHHVFSDENFADVVDIDTAVDRIGVFSRTDNVYDVTAGLVWEFARSWTLRPEVLYARTTSNVVTNEYSSTKFWIDVRKNF